MSSEVGAAAAGVAVPDIVVSPAQRRKLWRLGLTTTLGRQVDQRAGESRSIRFARLYPLVT
jgi:hypothetical protein